MNPPPTTDTPRPLLPAELNRSLVALLLELPPNVYADHRAHVEALAARHAELIDTAKALLDALDRTVITVPGQDTKRLTTAVTRLAQAIAPPAALPDTSPPPATA